MLFPSIADLVLATADSTFGMCKSVSAVVTLVLRRKVRVCVIRRWRLLQERFDASTSLKHKLVDVIAVLRSELLLHLVELSVLQL